MRLRSRHAALMLGPLVLLLAVSQPTQGQDPPDSRDGFAGRWALVPAVSEGRRTIASAFERALRDVNPVMRAIARQRVDTDAMLARTIEVNLSGSATVTTTMHTNSVHRFRTRVGYPGQVRTEGGGEARLTQVFREGRMELVFDFDEGRRWTVLSLSSDDHLRLTTTIDPNRLDENVRFSLDYRRAR